MCCGILCLELLKFSVGKFSWLLIGTVLSVTSGSPQPLSVCCMIISELVLRLRTALSSAGLSWQSQSGHRGRNSLHTGAEWGHPETPFIKTSGFYSFGSCMSSPCAWYAHQIQTEFTKVEFFCAQTCESFFLVFKYVIFTIKGNVPSREKAKFWKQLSSQGWVAEISQDKRQFKHPSRYLFFVKLDSRESVQHFAANHLSCSLLLVQLHLHLKQWKQTFVGSHEYARLSCLVSL